MKSIVQAKLFCSIFLALTIISCVFIGETLAGGKGNDGGMEDIILYNGNIVMRSNGGGKGKGKGKGKGGGGGSIVIAHSPSMEVMPHMHGFEHGHEHGGFGGWRRRR